VKINASQFRAELFKTLDAAEQGQEVVVTYKGREYTLVKKSKPSKFANVKQRPDAVLDWKGLVEDSPWDEAAWNEKWQQAPTAKKPASRR
jgi:hypothetical protein